MQSFFKSKRIIFILSILFPMGIDGIFTLAGQPSGYWREFTLVNEASPARILLQIHPLFFLLFGIIYATITVFLLMKLPWKFALPLGILVYTGHVWGNTTWIPRLVSITSAPIPYWYVDEGYFVIVALLLSFGIFYYYRNHEVHKSY